MERTLEWDGWSLIILNQVELPLCVTYRRASALKDVVEAIRRLEVRGAPAIGIAAAFGYVIGIREYNSAEDGAKGGFRAHRKKVCQTLAAARPTAVNLCWALERMEKKLVQVLCAASQTSGDQGREPEPEKWEPERPGALERLVQELAEEAQSMLLEDAAVNRAMGEQGQGVIPDGAQILTHCNTGALAASEFGTALGVMRSAREAGKTIHVYVDETRPLLQGARLTAWELWREGIPLTLITDSMAGFLMYQKKVDLVMVGADRIAANGDTANKIGTYSLAVLAREHGIPFYVAAPVSTIDRRMPDGASMIIEQRDPDEVRKIAGHALTLPDIPVYNPAFDVTPARYITGIITERGILAPPLSQSIHNIAGDGL